MEFYAGTPGTIEELAKVYPQIFRKSKVSKTPAKPASKRIAVGSKVFFCGQEAIVISKHENKGWWKVEVTKDGKTFATAGDRSLMTVI